MASGMLRIAAHEAGRYVRDLTPRTVLVALVVAVLLGLAGPAIRDRGIHPDAGLYRVEINRESVFFPVVSEEPVFVVLPGLHGSFGRKEADLLIVFDKIYYHDGSERSRSAVRELQLVTRVWLDRTLMGEADEDAAFPVRVNVIYEGRSITAAAADATSLPPPTGPPPTSGAPHPTPELLAVAGEQQLDLRPEEVQPPFPIRGLLLTFAYVVPLNFVSQLYGGSILTERIRQRGLLLLSTPHNRGAIVLGKSLPYVAFTVVAAAGTSVAIGAGWLGFLASLPILAFGLASTLLLGLLARSLRELTFLLVAITVLFSTFLFLPAIFTQIHPVAFLSPVSVIIASMTGQAVTAGAVAYATVPLAVAAAVLTGLSVALYKEETLFAPRTLLSKLVDAVREISPTRARLLLAGIFAVPFAIGLELFVLIFAVTLDLATAFVFFLVGGAIVEETLKGLVVYAHMQRDPKPLAPWKTGALVGGGFFLGEKFALVFSLVGFGLLPRGQDALATFGIATSVPLVLAPLLLHMVAATITATGARYGRRGLLLGWLVAVLVHAGYNAVLVLRFLPGAIG